MTKDELNDYIDRFIDKFNIDNDYRYSYIRKVIHKIITDYREKITGDELPSENFIVGHISELSKLTEDDLRSLKISDKYYEDGYEFSYPDSKLNKFTDYDDKTNQPYFIEVNGEKVYFNYQYIINIVDALLCGIDYGRIFKYYDKLKENDK